MKYRNAMMVLVIAVAFCSLAEGQTKQRANKKQIERGAWMVNLGGCNDCHTPKKMGPHGPVPDEALLLSGAPSHHPVPEIPAGAIGMEPGTWLGLFSADLTTWVGPWGVSFAANLTPDVETGTGSWTEAMFIKALRTGKHLGEGRPILPPMPWENFGKLSDDDLKAIFAYLRSIPPIKNAVREPIPPAGK